MIMAQLTPKTTMVLISEADLQTLLVLARDGLPIWKRRHAKGKERQMEFWVSLYTKPEDTIQVVEKLLIAAHSKRTASMNKAREAKANHR